MRLTAMWMGLLTGCAGVGVDPPPDFTPFERCTVDDAPTMSLIEEVDAPPRLVNTVGAMGLAVGDFDQDGELDLVLPQLCEDGEAAHEVLWGEAGAFGPERSLIALPCDNPVFSASVADVDGDGRVDVGLHGSAGTLIALSDGGRGWTTRWVETGACFVAGATWVDFDEDGLLDLSLSCQTADAYPHLLDREYEGNIDPGFQGSAWQMIGHRNPYLRGLGGGDFIAVDEGPTGEERLSFHSVGWDADDDGDADLISMNDFGHHADAVMHVQTEGGWATVPDCGFDGAAASMGGALADLDQDGRLELWSSNIGDLRALSIEPSGDGLSCTTHPAAGLLDQWDFSWSVNVLDVDGDGGDELHVAFGGLFEPGVPDGWGDANVEEQVSRLIWLDEGSGLHAIRAEPFGEAAMVWGAVTWFNPSDGRPRVVRRPLDGAPEVYEVACSGASRLVIQLRAPAGTPGGTHGRQARVRVRAEGIPDQQRTVGASDGTFSGTEPVVSFGVGQAEEVEVTITWPDGLVEERVIPAHGRLVHQRR